MNRRFVTALFSLTLGVAACVDESDDPASDDSSDDFDDDDVAEDCVATGLPMSVDGLESRDLDIGDSDGRSGFRAWQDGEAVDIIVGFQGSEMITPHLRVAGVDAETDRPCWNVELRHLDTSGESLGEWTYRSSLVFNREGLHHRAGPIFDDLYTEGAGSSLRLAVSVIGPDFAAQTEVDVELR